MKDKDLDSTTEVEAKLFRRLLTERQSLYKKWAVGL